jgi:hypothetical protein
LAAAPVLSTDRPLIQISGKNLGTYARGGCGACLWLLTQLSHHCPFNIFPRIFILLDALQKRVIHDYLDAHGAVPTWLSEVGSITGYQPPPHWSRFRMTDDEYGIVLTGAPDALLVRDDGRLIVADYKTARFAGRDDELYPVYETQLNVYALIAERLGMGEIAGLYLVYMEPCAPAAGQCALWVRREGFNLPLGVRVLQVDRHTTVNTTWRTVRTTGTARMTTEAGTAVLRARAMILRLSGCESGR